LGHLGHQRPVGSEIGIHFGTDANEALFHASPVPIPGFGLVADGIRISKIGGQIRLQGRLVSLDGIDTFALLVVAELHEVGMGM
jgi:hypothetical protein